MTQGSRVLSAIRVNTTPARAFAAFTEQIGQWWRPNGLFQFTRGRSGVLSFEPGSSGRLISKPMRTGQCSSSARCAFGTRRAAWS